MQCVALKPVSERTSCCRAVAGVAELRRFPGGDFVVFGVEEVVVAGRGQVGDAVADHFVDRHRHRSVLEERLFEVGDVVDDHLRPGAAGADRRGQLSMLWAKASSLLKALAKASSAFGSDVVDDLQPSPGPRRSALVRLHRVVRLQFLDRVFLAFAAARFGPAARWPLTSSAAGWRSGRRRPLRSPGRRSRRGRRPSALRLRPTAPEVRARGFDVQLRDPLRDHRASLHPGSRTTGAWTRRHRRQPRHCAELPQVAGRAR